MDARLYGQPAIFVAPYLSIPRERLIRERGRKKEESYCIEMVLRLGKTLACVTRRQGNLRAVRGLSGRRL